MSARPPHAIRLPENIITGHDEDYPRFIQELLEHVLPPRPLGARLPYDVVEHCMLLPDQEPSMDDAFMSELVTDGSVILDRYLLRHTSDADSAVPTVLFQYISGVVEHPRLHFPLFRVIASLRRANGTIAIDLADYYRKKLASSNQPNGPYLYQAVVSPPQQLSLTQIIAALQARIIDHEL